jgi:hypothetical protein
MSFIPLGFLPRDEPGHPDRRPLADPECHDPGLRDIGIDFQLRFVYHVTSR